MHDLFPCLFFFVHNSILVFDQVVICWSSLIVYGIVKLFQWYPLLSSWEGIAISVTFLMLVAIVMQILVYASESERFTPVGLSSQDPMSQALIHNYTDIKH